MKKRIGALLLAVMMVMGLALLAGCSPQNPLVGTWEALDGEDFDFGGCTPYMKFNKDGQWVLWLEDANGEKISGVQDTGTYSVDGNTLIIIKDSDSYYDDPNEYTYKISGNNLSLTGINIDDWSKFKRAR